MENNSNVDRGPIQELIFEARNKLSSVYALFKNFLSTKRAIVRGEKIYLWTNDKIIEKGYLTPWKFNLTETATTGIIASFTANSIQFISQEKPSQDIQEVILNEEFTGFFMKTASWLDPLVIPIFLTSVVFFFVWGSLKKADFSAEKRNVAKRAYLYFDGAYGLYSQFFIAFSVGFLSTSTGQSLAENEEYLIPFIGFIVLLAAAFIWQIRVSMKKIPKLVFEANGYSDRAKHFWQKSRPDDPPWSKLTLAHIIMGYPLLIVIELMFFAVTFALAYIAYFASGLF
jgi:hypothetical protein